MTVTDPSPSPSTEPTSTASPEPTSTAPSTEPTPSPSPETTTETQALVDAVGELQGIVEFGVVVLALLLFFAVIRTVLAVRR